MSGPDNPPAFPLAVPELHVAAHDGMSLRDWFAGRVLQAILSGPDEPLPYGVSLMGWRAEVAANSYAWADAMLAERSKA